MVLGSQWKKKRNGFQNSEKLKRQISLVHGSRFIAKKKGRENFLKFSRRKKIESGSWFTVLTGKREETDFRFLKSNKTNQFGSWFTVHSQKERTRRFPQVQQKESKKSLVHGLQPQKNMLKFSKSVVFYIWQCCLSLSLVECVVFFAKLEKGEKYFVVHWFMVHEVKKNFLPNF